jgi:hypothetical protein
MAQSAIDALLASDEPSIRRKPACMSWARIGDSASFRRVWERIRRPATVYWLIDARAVLWPEGSRKLAGRPPWRPAAEASGDRGVCPRAGRATSLHYHNAADLLPFRGLILTARFQKYMTEHNYC